MTGAGAIVAQRFGAVTAHENGARMFDMFEQGGRIFHRQLQMLGRDPVADRGGLSQIAGENEQRPAIDAGGDNFAPLHVGQLPLHGRRHGFEIGGVRGDQNRLRLFVMFGLGKQVHRDPVGIGAAVADDGKFGGPGYHVDADLAEHQLFRDGYIDIARAGNLVDFGNGRGAIGHGADRLGAADGIEPIHAGQRRRGQYRVVAGAMGKRRRGDNLADAGYARGNRQHQHGRRIACLAAGDVNAHARQSANLLPVYRAVLFGVLPGTLLLGLVITPDAFGGVAQGAGTRRRQPLQRLLHLAALHRKSSHVRGRQTVEAARVFENGLVAPRANVFEYGAHPAGDVFVQQHPPVERGGQPLAEIGFGRGQKIDVESRPAHGRSFSRRAAPRLRPSVPG